MTVALRMETWLALQLLEQLCGKTMTVSITEDNTTAIRVITSGKKPTIRHMSRTHRINIQFLHAPVVRKQVQLVSCRTDHMCVDIVSKHCTNLPIWRNVLENILHVRVQHVWGSVAEKSVHKPRKAKSGETSASPSQLAADRTLVELCCGPDSVLG